MLSQKDIHFLMHNAISAAYQAGSIIRTYRGKNFKQNKKSGMDGLAAEIVTEVDIKAEAVILDTLSYSCKIFDIAMLTEESPDDLNRQKKEYFWCIDPIDGTLYYSRNHAGYSVSIALVAKNGTPVISVIYDPYNDKLYTASARSAAKINNKVTSSLNKDKKVITIILDPDKIEHKSYQKPLTSLKDSFSQQGFNVVKILTFGGSVMNAVKTLENSPACYFKLPKENQGGGCVWDFAASSGIFTAQKFICTDINGNNLNLNPENSLYFNQYGVVFSTHEFIAKTIYEMYKAI